MAELPNILIITFDCLRPDHINSLGYKGTQTPTFDSLINSGTHFINAYSQAPNTWISHGCLFSGCNPYIHGVRTPLRKLSSKLDLMAEIIKENGYSTFGLPAISMLSSEQGFSRGFDIYNTEGLSGQSGFLSHRYYRPPEDTLAQTLQWIRDTPSPFFAWVHYFGIHRVDDAILDLPEIHRNQYSPYAQYYDGKITYADEYFLSPLIDELEQSGLSQNTILVLWSDHGEDLHAIEHNLYWGHNWNLNEDVMKTFLLFKGPGISKGVKTLDIAQSIDIFPTLLDLIGIPPLPQFEGRSLLADHIAPTPVIYMENLCQGFLGVRHGHFKMILSEEEPQETLQKQSKIKWRIEFIMETLTTLLPQRLKSKQHKRGSLAQWWTAAGEPEVIFDRLMKDGYTTLYDFSKETKEIENLASKYPGEVLKLKHILDKSTKETMVTQDIDINPSEKQAIEERLKDLGYLT